MDFNERLQKAIHRGQRASTARAAAQAERALNEQELQSLHTQYRLELSERIETRLRELTDNFPGFRMETIVSEAGWGAAISRDDLKVRSGRRDSLFSRFELLIRPFSSYHVLDLAGKGTIRNKELLSRSHYQPLTEVDPTTYAEMIDNWSLEYAELYASKS
jgi:hypothetical protein